MHTDNKPPSPGGVFAHEPCRSCMVPGTCATTCPADVAALIQGGACRVGAVPGVGRVEDWLARMIDHTLLKPDATRGEIEKLCEEARRHRFATVCVNPYWVATCAKLLADTPVKVASVVGFPFGAATTEGKAFEASLAIRDGASEIDMVINVGALRSGDLQTVERDIREVVRATGPNCPVKVILETAYLTDQEKVKACLAARNAGAAFVKTSTGYSPSGATAQDVALMRQAVGEALGVKASGGIRDVETALKMVEAGATRIGASASVKIVSGARAAPEGY